MPIIIIYLITPITTFVDRTKSIDILKRFFFLLPSYLRLLNYYLTSIRFYLHKYLHSLLCLNKYCHSFKLVRSSRILPLYELNKKRFYGVRTFKFANKRNNEIMKIQKFPLKILCTRIYKIKLNLETN